MNLYELTGNVLALQNMLQDSPDELTVDVIKDTLELTQADYEYKIESYAKVVKNLEADIDAYKNEARRLLDRAKSLEKNIDNLKKAMFDSMKVTDTPKVKGQLFTISIQKNGGKLPIILNDNVTIADLPDEVVKVVESVDTDKLRALIDSGNTQYAHYGERGESLRIK